MKGHAKQHQRAAGLPTEEDSVGNDKADKAATTAAASIALQQNEVDDVLRRDLYILEVQERMVRNILIHNENNCITEQNSGRFQRLQRRWTRAAAQHEQEPKTKEA